MPLGSLSRMRHSALLFLAAAALVRGADLEFGVYDYSLAADDGWQLASAATVSAHAATFVAQYNADGGLPIIKPFQSGNCCISLKGGMKLILSGSPYGFQFPATTEGALYCSPAGGYTAARLQFYRMPTLPTTVTFSSKAACATSHNPGIFWREKKAAVPANVVRFGIYNFEAAPSAGWELMSAADLTLHRDAFVSDYNLNGGINVIKRFVSGNCCIAVKGGLKLIIESSKYKFQFPANAEQKIRCSPADGYTDAKLQFYLMPTLTPTVAFAERAECVTASNPGIYMKVPEPETLVKVDFGIFDYARKPSGDWVLMTAADINAHKEAFVAQYNANQGLKVIELFQSGNCCFALGPSGNKLKISGTPYGYQFPASVAGGIRCNPTGGYSETHYQFYRTPTLSASATFSETAACATNHNPGIFMRRSDALFKPTLQFGLYEHESVPSGGWQIMSIEDYLKYKVEFTEDYNAKKGVDTIKSFISGNCCIAVKGGDKLIISGTPYGYQFPANSPDGQIRCNPTAGYADERYMFYRSNSIAASATFSKKPACAVSHNPAVFYRLVSNAPVEPARTSAPTPAPIHCAASPWGAWSACSISCGEGTRSRARFVTVDAQHGGKPCDVLSEVQACLDQDCPVHCELTPWTAWEPCNAVCGGGQAYRAREVAVAPNALGSHCEHLRETKSCNAHPCPIHCQVSEWSPWSGCNAECGGGTESRRRMITVDAQFNGDACPPTQDERVCGTTPCPVHCEVHQWGTWSGCNALCGGGFRSRERGVHVQPAFNGDTCPPLIDTALCNTGPCPVHCVTSSWSAWSSCSVTCGGGTARRERSVITSAQFSGTPCPALADEKSCGTQHCPIDCAATPWAAWTACSATCGGGIQAHTRTIAAPSQHGGAACPSLNAVRSCNTTPCAVHCDVSSWSEWSTCTVTCAGGTRNRTRSITRQAAHGGYVCPALSEAGTCASGLCPVNCAVGTWTVWSACSLSCGNGSSMRSRKITTEPNAVGQPCPALRETKVCTTLCPVHCTVSAFGAWSPCTKSCGNGKQTHTRSVQQASKHGGAPCPTLTETTSCNVQACPIDCVVSVWSAWGACSLSCGSGVRTRARTIQTPIANGGAACPAGDEEGSCNVAPCAQDCVVDEWASWSECSHSCGYGSQRRHRVVATVADHGGKACPTLDEARVCFAGPCPVHCDVSSWSDWQVCSASCGGGTKVRRRTVVTHADNGGYVCPELSQSAGCNSHACPLDCIVSSYGRWGPCSKSCGGGIQTRTREVTRSSKHGGVACPTVAEQGACNKQSCAVDCSVSSWSDWGACSTTCGDGASLRTRTVVATAQYGGKDCPMLKAFMFCHMGPCPVHCDASSWSEFSACSKTCGNGSKTRTRTIVSHAMHGGYVCPSLKEEIKCNDHACPVDCELSLYSEWTVCSATCGAGSRRRERTVSQHAQHGGLACGKLVDTALCNTAPCPVDCIVSTFSEWSECTRTCGTGSTMRQRTISRAAEHAGLACPPLEESKVCNVTPCPTHCTISDFGDWGDCSLTCGGGKQVRERHVTTHAQNGGNVCEELSQSRACNTGPCPVDCISTSYGVWSACSTTCGRGLQSRSRTHTRMHAHGGRPCGNTREQRECNLTECPIHCELTPFGQWGACTMSCGTGYQQRKRDYAVKHQHGGVCSALSETRACNTANCPIDCMVSEFESWTACTSSCGGGLSSRARSTSRAATFGGKVCPHPTEQAACNAQACPVDCAMTTWSAYSACSHSCGSGDHTSTRIIATMASHGGEECGTLSHTRSCSNGPCPVHCEVTPFEKWSDCSRSCGGGSQTRARAVTTATKYGGSICPFLHESQGCNMEPCPVNCLVGSWSLFTECHATCGGGFRHRSRSVDTAAAHSGKACPVLEDVQVCNTAPCPIDCVMSAFSDWSDCSRSCGGGTQLRTRSIAVHTAVGGKACSGTEENQECSTHHCAVDCDVNAFGRWTPCSVTCGGGSHTRSRSVTTAAAYGGKACPPLSNAEPCNTAQCPVDCAVSAWVDWSACTKSCSVGRQSRSRTMITAASHGGLACGKLAQTQGCSDGPCPMHCQVSSFTAWSTCTKTCGGGKQSRSRTVVSSAQHGGYTCPFLAEDRSCNTDACPLDCQLSSFNAWTTCTHTCGAGTRFCSRSIVVAPQYGGVACGSTIQSSKCNEHACPLDCVVSDYGDWTACTKSCGGGWQAHTRTKLSDAQHGGVQCPALKKSRACSTAPCPVDCILNTFDDWSSCSASCGGGTHTRSRTVRTAVAHGGLACGALEEQRSCNAAPCPIDCAVSYFADWSACSLSCGIGTQVRTRTVTVAAAYGGDACPANHEKQECNAHACPVDCVMSPFEVWGDCSKTCGSGLQKRSRSVDRSPAFGGAACANEREIRVCSTHACPVDCVTSDFGEWGACSKTCAKGTQLRTRVVDTAAQLGGAECGALQEQRGCNHGPCPVHCDVSEFTSWSPCSKSCGTGTQTRTRDVLNHAEHGGYVCPFLSEFQDCNTRGCPVNCVISSFSAWTKCTVSCGAGSQSRTRSATTRSANGGLACPVLSEVRICNAQSCPSDCFVSSFGEWSGCTRTCGWGYKTRSRSVNREAEFGGVKCPALDETSSCAAKWCPVDCQMSEWDNWDECTKTCAGGKKTRRRSVNRDPAYGGKGCPPLSDTAMCNVQPCPVDCQTSTWALWSACSVSCGAGVHMRARSITEVAQHGGVACAAVGESRACHHGACPVHCDVSSFGPWTVCSRTCGSGMRARTRIITTHAMHGGYTCPTLEERQPCNELPCPVDCDVTSFSQFTPCSRSCGTGYKKRARAAITPAKFGGKQCPVLMESFPCNNQPCPIDCEVTPFGAWTPCSLTCGGGTQQQERSVNVLAAFGGKTCPELRQTRACGTGACPIDCEMTVFTGWSRCSTSCGDGLQTQTRSIVREAHFGGAACAHVSQTMACFLTTCPVDCRVGDWTAWSTCSKSCGDGSKSRSRSLISGALHGGIECPPLHAQVTCSAGPCPVHCVASDWGQWSSCSVTCGGGRQLRSRSVVSHAAHGGYTCPALSMDQQCNVQACPVDCTVSSWRTWTVCSNSCGSGNQGRTRVPITNAAHGGKACSTLTSTRQCNTHACPKNCDLSWFSDWQACSTTCGSGSQTRTRTVINEAADGGTCEGALSELRPCNEGTCPIHCEVSEWTRWTVCTQTCGGGTKERTRSVFTEANDLGRVCPNLMDSEACNTHPCPVGCAVSGFSAWTACSVSCGVGGTQVQDRVVSRSAKYGGSACPSLTNSRTCSGPKCPINCAVSAFGIWEECSVSCGSGLQIRRRTVLVAAADGGAICPLMVDSRMCNVHSCPTDCEWEEYAQWGSCTHTCGGGSKTRARAVKTRHANGGKPCTGTELHVESCNRQACPQDCAFTVQLWSVCSKSCGTGVQVRTRTITQAAKHGGVVCPASREVRSCNTHACPVDCVTSAWAQWGACSKSCDEGSQQRTRSIATAAAHGGTCGALSERRFCQDKLCPEHCEVSSFAAWGACSTSCGSGKRQRARSVVVQNRNGGLNCPHLVEYGDCNTHACPVDCVLTSWTAWGACTKTCGSGEHIRERDIATPPVSGGAACSHRRESKTCHDAPCPVDCTVTTFSGWSTCTKSCGTGTQSRVRSSVAPAGHGGKDCPHMKEDRRCNYNACPIDCVLQPFGDWTACTLTCGGGTRTRTRGPMQQASFGGEACPSAHQTGDCNAAPCPVDCVVSGFGEWGGCSRSCGGTGKKMRHRTIERSPKYGGKVCPPLTSTNACNAHSCPINCVLSYWSDWSNCNKSCGPDLSGTQTRTRSVTVAADHGGTGCAANSEQRHCSPGRCPIHCIVSPWAPWSTCTKSCGRGTSARTRSVLMHDSYGGYVCPELSASRGCNEHPCGVPCELGDWSEWSTCSTTCGEGTQRRTRPITSAALHGGHCQPDATRSCTLMACPVHCVVASWQAWGACSNACGIGAKSRSRSVTQPSENGGKGCPSTTQTQTCVGSSECGWKPCTHVKCRYMPHHKYGEPSTRVSHHRSEENGHRHHCNINAATMTCQCSCYRDPWHRLNFVKPGDRASHAAFQKEARNSAAGTAQDMNNWPLVPVGIGKPSHAIHGEVTQQSATHVGPVKQFSGFVGKPHRDYPGYSNVAFPQVPAHPAPSAAGELYRHAALQDLAPAAVVPAAAASAAN